MDSFECWYHFIILLVYLVFATLNVVVLCSFDSQRNLHDGILL